MPDDLVRRALAVVGRPPAGRLVVTGPIAGGKTRAVTALAEALGAQGCRVGGIVAPRVLIDGRTVGYDATDLATGLSTPLARLDPPGTPAGRFFLSAEGLVFAAEAVRRGLRDAEVVIVDEIGPVELAGHGHAAAVRDVVAAGSPAVFVVRRGIVEAAIATFGMAGTVLLDIERYGAGHPSSDRRATDPA